MSAQRKQPDKLDERERRIEAITCELLDNLPDGATMGQIQRLARLMEFAQRYWETMPTEIFGIAINVLGVDKQYRAIMREIAETAEADDERRRA